ncbi:MAG: lactonase family protein [Clostridiales bacterium]|nr:lactonase family protein [Clostridiales bacterium]
MAEERYVAYVGTYTRGKSEGIYILDIDTDTWTPTVRKAVSAYNPSDVLVSNSGEYLYCTTDQGVASFKIMPDGDLEFMNLQWTGGMRGCYLETDDEDNYLFVAGFYDGRISVMHLNDDGTIGDISDGVFHQGMGVDASGRNLMPHITCVKMAPDLKGLFAVDNGLDQVKSYDFDEKTGKLKLRDIIRCELDSHPRLVHVDWQGQIVYILMETANQVAVYKLPERGTLEENSFIKPIQKVPTLAGEHRRHSASFGMDFSRDRKHLFVSNTTTNIASIFDIDPDTGLLTMNCFGSLSGDYPKAIAAMPDGEHFIALGQNTGTITTYKVNYEEKYFLMSAKPLLVEQPNSIYIHKLA